MVEKNEIKDLRDKDSEFCQGFSCEKYLQEVSCTFCPYVKDVLEMAKGLHMVLPSWNYFTSTMKSK
jgi:hypothetical protein